MMRMANNASRSLQKKIIFEYYVALSKIELFKRKLNPKRINTVKLFIYFSNERYTQGTCLFHLEQKPWG